MFLQNLEVYHGLAIFRTKYFFLGLGFKESPRTDKPIMESILGIIGESNISLNTVSTLRVLVVFKAGIRSRFVLGILFSVNSRKHSSCDMPMCVSTVQTRTKRGSRSWGVVFFSYLCCVKRLL